QRGPDPLELLRADVGVVSGDLAAVNSGLSARFQELHDALDASAAQREQTLAARIATLEARLAAAQDAAAKNDAAFAAALNAQSEALSRLAERAESAEVPVT